MASSTRARLLFVVAALSVVGVLNAGCAAEEPQPTPLDQVKKSFDGHSVAVIPFDVDNPACREDPTAMTPETLGACAYLDAKRLPADVEITTDPRSFDPRTERSMMLVVWGPSLDPTREGWIGIVGLGAKRPVGGGSLTGSSVEADALHPSFFPLVVGGAVLLDSWAMGGLLFGASAIVVTQTMINQNQGRPLIRSTERLITETTQLVRCPEDEHRRLATRQREACRTLPGRCARFLVEAAGSTTSTLCDGLASRRTAYDNCRQARQDVVDICFEGRPDANHEREIAGMQNVVSGCTQDMARLGC